MALDYVASYSADRGTDVLHFGVKGMKWGVRKGSSSGGSVSLARRHEDMMAARAKRVNKLVQTRAHVEAGKRNLVTGRGDKKLSTQQALKKLDRKIARLTPKNHVLIDSEGKVLVRNKKVVPKEKPAPVDPATESQTAKYHRLKSQLAVRGAHSLDTEDLQFLNSRTDAIAKASKLLETPESWLSKTVKSTVDAASKKILKDVTQALVTKHVTPKLHNRLRLPLPPPVPPPTPTP
jgi:hypothetical protein